MRFPTPWREPASLKQRFSNNTNPQDQRHINRNTNRTQYTFESKTEEQPYLKLNVFR